MLIKPYSLYKYINNTLGSESWLNWEPETIEREFSTHKDAHLNKYGIDPLFTNIVDAIRAIKSEKSDAFQNWHIFENVALVFSGNIPIFGETTPPEPYEMFYALHFLKDFFSDLNERLSDEVKVYIGSLFITDGILFHLCPLINECIKLTLQVNNFDFSTGITKQQHLLEKLVSNKNLMQKLSNAVLGGSDNVSIPDNIDIDVRRAVQLILTFMNAERVDHEQKELLDTFLKDTPEVEKHTAPAVDLDRANYLIENIANIFPTDADNIIQSKANAEDASVGEVEPEHEEKYPTSFEEAIALASEELETEKAASDISAPGLMGFSYHSGHLYNVSGEIGRDDVPKSTLLGLPGHTTGVVTDRGDDGKNFTSPSTGLKVLDEHGQLIQPAKGRGDTLKRPTDSSLELAEV